MNVFLYRLAAIKQSLKQTGDSELEQALLRVFIGFLLVLVFCIPWGENERFSDVLSSIVSLIVLDFFVLGVCLAIAIVKIPKPNPARRVFGVLLDLVSLSVLMYAAADETVFLFVFYLWVILGNGFRYGVTYLYISLAVGVVGFSFAITWGEYWQAESTRSIAQGLLLLLVLISAYSAFNIKKLHRSLSDAREKNEAKTKFLASMSHELRTPLNGVIGLGDSLRATKLDKEQHDLVKTIHLSAYTLLGLLEKVLDVSKVDSGKLEINYEEFDLHPQVNSVQSNAEVAGSLTVTCNIDSEVSFLLKGDEQHLKQVLVNLIDNIIKFTNDSSVPTQGKSLTIQNCTDWLAEQANLATEQVISREQEIVICLAKTSECRDGETRNHIIRVTKYAREIAEELGLSQSECDDLESVVPMHDIGKIAIPDEVLLKPGKLNAAEWEIMQSHAMIGYEILSNSQSKYMQMGAVIALHHHERFDGKGYPKGLKGTDIPLIARIVTVDDIYDALVSTARPYKDAWPVQKAIDYLKSQAGIRLDPQCVDAFCQRISQIMQIQCNYTDEDVLPKNLAD